MPYYLTGLARVARTTGYPVIEVDGWEKRGHGPMSDVRSIIVHHTAGGPSGNFPSMGTVLNGRPELPGPLCHYGLGRDGTIFVVAAGLAAHAGKDSQVSAVQYRNQHAIGIEAENTGTGAEPWGDKQLDSYVKLCRALADEFGLTANAVKGHKEIAIPVGRKPDPRGIDMNTFRNWVKRGYYIKPSLTPQSNIVEKDTLTMADITDLQKAINAIPANVLASQVPVIRGGEKTTRSVGTLLSGHDNALNALTGIVSELAKRGGLTAEEVKAAAKAGAGEAIDEGFTIEGTATVELKAAE